MLWVPDYDGLAPGGGSAWTIYSGRGDIIGRVSAPEPDIVVMAVDDDIAAVLIVDELGVQTVELRRITICKSDITMHRGGYGLCGG